MSRATAENRPIEMLMVAGVSGCAKRASDGKEAEVRLGERERAKKRGSKIERERERYSVMVTACIVKAAQVGKILSKYKHDYCEFD